jgi:sporulation protein YlmC with PRC-barrel domain
MTMRKISYFLVSLLMTSGMVSFAASGVAQAAEAVAGKSIYAQGGKRIGVVYAVKADGSAQVILNGKLVTIPASTITAANGKIETSMDKKQVLASR